jgi:hypothetical protein
MAKPARTGRQIILRAIRNTLAATIVLLAIAFLADYAVLRFRVATNRSPTATVTVRPVYAVPHKNRSTEFLLGDPREQTCVNSLFPHMGDAPCWYLQNHKEQQINM